VVERLLGLGADVRACEPYLPKAGAHALPAPVVDCTPGELAAADLVLLLVDHPDFDLDDIATHARLLLDTKGVMRPRTFEGETL
jgi:UDP-N-acetyl-D-glucosamine dehydrogenase